MNVQNMEERDQTTGRILVLTGNTTAQEASALMKRNGDEGAFVVDRLGEVRGVVTRRDLAFRAVRERMHPRTKVSRVLSFAFEPASSHEIGIGGTKKLEDIAGHSSGCRPSTLRERERALDHFLGLMASRIKLPEEIRAPVAFFLLKQIASRVSPQFSWKLSRLIPELIREDIDSIRPLLPTQTNLRDLKRQIHGKYGLEGEGLAEVLTSFWQGLKAALGKRDSEILFLALPPSMQEVFEPKDYSFSGAASDSDARV